MDFELDAAGAEAERRAESFLRDEAAAVAGFAALLPAQAVRLLRAARQAVGGEVAGRLKIARASPALLLACEASRHLADLTGGAPGPDRLGAVALADAAEVGPARLLGDGRSGYRLRAVKPLVANAARADLIGVFARGGAAGTGEADALVLVAPGDPGIRVGPAAELLGLEGLGAARIEAEDAPVVPANVISGAAAAGLAERYRSAADLSAAVAAAGLMRGSLLATSRHAHRHQRDGKPIAARQEVGFKLAEVLALAEAAELLCHRAAWLQASGDAEAATLARCAKVFCTESAERAASACLQIAGGEGYRRGSGAERAFRDAKGLVLAGTTVERARMAIADALLGGEP